MRLSSLRPQKIGVAGLLELFQWPQLILLGTAYAEERRTSELLEKLLAFLRQIKEIEKEQDDVKLKNMGDDVTAVQEIHREQQVRQIFLSARPYRDLYRELFHIKRQSAVLSILRWRCVFLRQVVLLVWSKYRSVLIEVLLLSHRFRIGCGDNVKTKTARTRCTLLQCLAIDAVHKD